MVPKLCTNLPIASILQANVLNVTSLCGYEVLLLQQLAAHKASLSYHKLNSIDVVPPVLACVVVIPLTFAFPPAPQDEDEIC